MRSLKIQNLQYCHPRVHGWLEPEPEPGGCCCGTLEERFAVVGAMTAILGRECLRFSVDFHDYL